MARRAGMGLMLAAGLMLVVLPACQYTQEHRKTAYGAGIGAAGGAIAGGLLGGTRKSMVVGGLVGALAGGLVGAYMDHQDKSAAETNTAHSYSANQGVQIALEKASAEPTSVAPGQQVGLQMTYAVMAPDPQQEVTVRENRLVTLNGEKVVDRDVDIVRTPGTYTRTLPVTLPDDAPKGTYQYVASISAGSQSSQMTGSFTVN